MKKIIILTSILILTLGCNSNEKKFNSRDWKPIENGLYGENNRKKMVNDLIFNNLQFDQNKGTKRKSVITLIGEPDFIDDCSEYETYRIEEKFGLIDPIGYTFLKLEYNKDSILIYWKIEESKFKE
jgi:hypothetical protein